MTIPNNRQESLRISHPYYFTGKPCIHGHIAKRDSKDRKCIDCELVFVRKRIKEPNYKAKHSAWCQANKEKRRASASKSRRSNAEMICKRNRDWWARNQEKQAQKRKIWAANNKPKIYAHNAARRAQELLATPPWVFVHQKDFETIYAERERIERETGIKQHVDHIYPLRGKNSCGLHVPWNLQVIPAKENLKKRNKNPEDIIMSPMVNGYRFLGGDLRNNVVHAP